MTRRLILDANLAVLLVVGSVDPRFITAHKRLSAFSEADFEILIRFVARYDRFVLVPNVLTETSNLLRHTREPLRSTLCEALAVLIRQHGEVYQPSREAIARAEYIRLGLTDSVLLELASSGKDLLTADLDLYIAALAVGAATTNFTHLREAAYNL